MLDEILKIAQAVFYVTATVLAVLTYRSARRGLLNTINTEYHKKVIERLAQVNEMLFSEFDFNDEKSWHKNDHVKNLFERINEQVEELKPEILSGEGDKLIGTPILPLTQDIWNAGVGMKTDPFIPEALRLQICSLFEGRKAALIDADTSIKKRYVANLAKNKHWDDLEGAHLLYHNKHNELLYESGFGIGQVEKRVHEIRLLIQKYFAGFDPRSRPIWHSIRKSIDDKPATRKASDPGFRPGMKVRLKVDP